MSISLENAPQGTPPRVIVKLRERHQPPLVAATAPNARGPGGPGGEGQVWQRLRERFPQARVTRLYQSVAPEQLDQMVRQANRARPGAVQAPNLNLFHAITVPAGVEPAQIASLMASDREQVESAQVDPGVAPARVNPWNDPNFGRQGYVRGRRRDGGVEKRGIYANYAWGFPNGDGTGVGVVVMDFGFRLTHEDFAGAGITTIHGSHVSPDHGTACLGQISGQDNTRGIVGIAPKARARVVTLTTGSQDAIIKAAASMSAGDVLSMSLQTKTTNYPLEIIDSVFWSIWVATALGRIICTAAGNGGHDLDAFTSGGKYILRRGHADFRDSGAIVVGAGSDTTPHDRLSFSNFGTRVDCFAWGQNVFTTVATSNTSYTPSFNGTSAATPIIAGAAVLTQALTRASCRRTLTPTEMRSVLSHPRTSIPSRSASDRIGRMPNMSLVHTHFIRPSCRITGAYGSPGECAVFLDPGHGGEGSAGHSTAYGGQSHGGAAEKDVTLELARRIQARFGRAAALSRDGDYNLSIRDRLAASRQSGARAFVSLHAHERSSRRDEAPTIWVYGDGRGAPDPFGAGLAESIRGELAALGTPASVREGNIGMLHPRHHGEGVAACLVEAGSLGRGGDHRLGRPEVLDVLGEGLSRGIQRYLGNGSENRDDEVTDDSVPSGQSYGEDTGDDDERFGSPSRWSGAVHPEAYGPDGYSSR